MLKYKIWHDMICNEEKCCKSGKQGRCVGVIGRIDSMAKIRNNNRRALLRQIRQKGQISRVQLAQSLRLSKSTVTENIAPLLQAGVIQETGVGAAQVTGGRRPVMLRINGTYRYIIAAELGMHQPIFALADFNGKLLIRRTANLPDDAPYATRLRVSKETIRQILRDGNVPGGSLGIIALSSPGAYSHTEKAFLLNPEFENWNVGQLTQDLETAFGTRVFRVNDVNAAAVGEYYKGAGHMAKNMLFLSCGIGVGYGVVLKGKLYEGVSGSAGEVARSSIAGKPLRTQVEIAALLARVQQNAPPETKALIEKRGARLDFETLVWLWQQQDAFVHACVDEIAQILGEVTAFSLSLLNCEIVVLGGDYLVFESQILPVMNEVIQREAFDPVRVVASALRQDAGIQGLLGLAADAILDDISSCRE